MAAAVHITKEADLVLEWEVLRINVLQEINDSALLTHESSIKDTREGTNLPSSFVPGRNIFFLTAAAAMAYKLDAHTIIGGMCQTDFSGYPDCRRGFIDSLEVTLSLGMDYLIRIDTPLMHMDKRESIQLAQALPGCMNALKWSYTCYEGKEIPCGKCPACLLRIKAFKEAGIPDPYLERIGQMNGR